MTLARCRDAEKFSHGLPRTTGPSPNTVKPEARETDPVGYCTLSSELTKICVGSDGAAAQKEISSIVSEVSPGIFPNPPSSKSRPHSITRSVHFLSASKFPLRIAQQSTTPKAANSSVSRPPRPSIPYIGSTPSSTLACGSLHPVTQGSQHHFTPSRGAMIDGRADVPAGVRASKCPLEDCCFRYAIAFSTSPIVFI